MQVTYIFLAWLVLAVQNGQLSEGTHLGIQVRKPTSLEKCNNSHKHIPNSKRFPTVQGLHQSDHGVCKFEEVLGVLPCGRCSNHKFAPGNIISRHPITT